MFLIHGGADDAGHRNPDYYRAAGQPKQIWEARGGHTDGIDEQPREYERRVVGFLDRALLGGGCEMRSRRGRCPRPRRKAGQKKQRSKT